MRRRGVGHLLNHRLAQWRREERPDGAGGVITEWVDLGPLRCRISQPSAAERIAAQQAGAEHTQPVYLSPAASVRRGDELREPGRTWRVVAVYTPSEPVYLRADCELIQTEGGAQ